MSTNTTNAPIDKHFDGPTFMKIWRNFNQDQQPYYNTTVGRIYTDKESGEVRETRNLGDDDLLRLAGLAARARHSIRRFKAQDREQAQSQEQGAQSKRKEFRQSRQQAPSHGEERGPQP